MFTDFKSDLYPLGEMLEMHGGCGDGQYICEYDRKTILKARQTLKEIEEQNDERTEEQEQVVSKEKYWICGCGQPNGWETKSCRWNSRLCTPMPDKNSDPHPAP